MGIKRTLLTGLMALCLGVTSLAAADGTFVKRDSLGREIRSEEHTSELQSR